MKLMPKLLPLRSRLKGFTLIELLVVMSIISALTALTIVSFLPAQKQARDTQRKSDLKQYQNSLELFANKNNGLYPSRNTAGGDRASVNLCKDLGMTTCPEDPKYTSDPTQVYDYQSDGSGSGNPDATSYVLWDKTEFKAGYFVICSNGKAGTPATLPTISGGTCPL